VESQVSALRQALYRGDRAAAAQLAAEGANLNVFDAAALGDADTLKRRLVENPQDAHEYSADGFTALHFAAFLGGVAEIRVLIDAGADVNAVSRNDMKVQPLHSAAAQGSVEACNELLIAGADVNAQQQGGFTPMDEALIKKNDEMAALFLEHGGKPSGNELPT
jgi:ankyrin repeat protein